MDLLDSEPRTARFWELLEGEARRKHALEPEPAQREHLDAEQFERESFPWQCPRPHWLCGRRVLDASTEEAARWLDEDEFTARLRKYAGTARFRERQRAEEDARPEQPEWMKNSD